MAIKDDDLLYVQRPSGADAGSYKIEAGDLLESPVDISSTAPSPAKEGDLWWDEVSGVLFVYYEDADSSQWVPATPTPVKPGTTKSVKDFGAEGDGATDDTDSFENALDFGLKVNQVIHNMIVLVVHYLFLKVNM